MKWWDGMPNIISKHLSPYLTPQDVPCIHTVIHTLNLYTSDIYAKEKFILLWYCKSIVVCYIGLKLSTFYSKMPSSLHRHNTCLIIIHQGFWKALQRTCEQLRKQSNKMLVVPCNPQLSPLMCVQPHLTTISSDDMHTHHSARLNWAVSLLSETFSSLNYWNITGLQVPLVLLKQ